MSEKKCRPAWLGRPMMGKRRSPSMSLRVSFRTCASACWAGGLSKATLSDSNGLAQNEAHSDQEPSSVTCTKLSYKPRLKKRSTLRLQRSMINIVAEIFWHHLLAYTIRYTLTYLLLSCTEEDCHHQYTQTALSVYVHELILNIAVASLVNTNYNS